MLSRAPVYWRPPWTALVHKQGAEVPYPLHPANTYRPRYSARVVLRCYQGHLSISLASSDRRPSASSSVVCSLLLRSICTTSTRSYCSEVLHDWYHSFFVTVPTLHRHIHHDATNSIPSKPPPPTSSMPNTEVDYTRRHPAHWTRRAFSP